ncbi:PPC domain-containing DNA-binding protein [Hyphomicrobium sp.]|uniref:PPC domain-containing DNA-binding protein n=1 Tax=Hyphomicrobium sp. TaxID=82 RepID=UPI0025C6E2A3|nr:PPC domain-containing DNA-binding protein [Hyphomicrobium sp.]MCC7253982.1 DNA-binding protein [Hyphomicrobium sp.]
MVKPTLYATLALLVSSIFPAHATEATKRYIRTPTGFLVVLRQGDNVIGELESLAARENLPSASLVGIGFLRKVTFGFYDFSSRSFLPKTFHDVEITTLSGSIAWKNGKPSIHAHGAVSGRDFQVVGGHILEAEIGTGSAEITIVTHDTQLQRAIDPSIGVNVLDLGKE